MRVYRAFRGLVPMVIAGIVIGWPWGYASSSHGVFPAQIARDLTGRLREYGLLADRYDSRMHARLARYGEAISLGSDARTWMSRLAHGMALSRDSVRTELLRRTIVPQSLVTLSSTRTEHQGTVISASYYGIRVRGVFFAAHRRPSCLIAYHQGHEGDPLAIEEFRALRDSVVSRGCDVLALSMLGLGLNGGPVWYPTRRIYGNRRTVSLTTADAAQHGAYALFADSAHPELSPIALFVTGSYYIIDSLSRDYRDVYLVGISGGGWYTTLLAALLPKVKTSIAIAGSLPLALRIEGEEGEYEQVFADLWSSFDYSHLYILGTLDRNGRQSRQVHLVYNKRDPCCFSDPEASMLSAWVSGLRGVSVHVLDRAVHTVDVNAVLRLLRLDQVSVPPA